MKYMQSIVKRFTFLDAVLILVLFFCAVFFGSFIQSSVPDTVVIFKDKTLIARYPLNEDRTFFVRGEIGSMKIRIKDSAIRVDSATCPERLCVRTRPISKTSQQIICEPNHVVLEISSLKSGGLDAMSR